MSVYRCTSSVKVQVYQKTNVYTLTNATVRGALPDVQVVRCDCTNAMSQGGMFSVTLKSNDAAGYAQAIRDDDWVDISFGKNGIYWHVMRGIIDDVRLTREASDGASTTSLILSGRSFQKAFETTNSYFFPLLQENYLFDALSKISGGMTFLVGPPEKLVETILFDLFNYIGTLPAGTRANWALPTTLPVCNAPIGTGQATLSDVAVYDTSFVDDLRQSAVAQDKSSLANNSIFGDQSLWQMAQGFCDPMFCELYTDVLPQGGLPALAKDPSMAGGLDVSASCMTIVQRDKPFLMVSADTLRPSLSASSFFQLPVLTVQSDEVRNMSLGKNGMERFNCFNVAAPSNVYLGAAESVTLRYPLWSAADMEAHGLRRMDAQTIFLAKNQFGGGLAALRAAQKSQLCDFYCLNADYFSGTLTLANSHPEMRIGTRLRIDNAVGDDFEAYVEAISHTWAVNRLSTQVQFTRGFFGDANALTQRLQTKRSEFEVAGTLSVAALETAVG